MFKRSIAAVTPVTIIVATVPDYSILPYLIISRTWFQHGEPLANCDRFRFRVHIIAEILAGPNWGVKRSAGKIVMYF